MPPWAWMALGAVLVVFWLGWSGNLYSVPPVDRVLNPDAHHYWQSEKDYVDEIIRYCAHQAFSLGQGGKRGADRCVDTSLAEAVDCGYLHPAWNGRD